MTVANKNNKFLKTSEDGLNLIKHYEGFSSTPYICPTGHLTIGYGHKLNGRQTQSLTKEEATNLLAQDVQKFEAGILSVLNVRVKQNQFDALVSFTYNLGIGALRKSTLLKKINLGLHEEVPAQFKRWVYGRINGKMQVLQGLVRRREAEANLYSSVQA